MAAAAAAIETLGWSFGLRDLNGSYLTAETFGFTLNSIAKLMKKKQSFFLEQEGDYVYLRT
jgi:hypothetical protein